MIFKELGSLSNTQELRIPSFLNVVQAKQINLISFFPLGRGCLLLCCPHAVFHFARSTWLSFKGSTLRLGKGFVQVNGRGRRAWDASGDLVLHTSTEIQAAASPLLWAIPAHLYLQEAMRQSRCTLTMESQVSVLGQRRPQHHPLHSAVTTSLQPNPPAQAQQDPAEQNQGKCTAGSWHRHNPSPGHGLGLRLSAQPQTGNQLRGFIHLFSLSHLIYFSVLAP